MEDYLSALEFRYPKFCTSVIWPASSGLVNVGFDTLCPPYLRLPSPSQGPYAPPPPRSLLLIASQRNSLDWRRIIEIEYDFPDSCYLSKLVFRQRHWSTSTKSLPMATVTKQKCCWEHKSYSCSTYAWDCPPILDQTTRQTNGKNSN